MLVTRRVLLTRVWGGEPSPGSKTLDAHVRRIRAKIEDDPSVPDRIVTIRGLGYRYNPQEAPGSDGPVVTGR